MCISFKFCNWYIPIQQGGTNTGDRSGCVYPSNFAIDTFLYNNYVSLRLFGVVVYILQILQLIHSYTTFNGTHAVTVLLCISFKFCNWYIPIQQGTSLLDPVLCCVYPSNFAIDTFLYNSTCKSSEMLMLCISFKFCNWYIPIQQKRYVEVAQGGCVYPSNFAIDTFLYNTTGDKLIPIFVVYILQILQLIHSYTTRLVSCVHRRRLCISFKFCNWYIPIQHAVEVVLCQHRCVYPSNFAIDTFLYNLMYYRNCRLMVVYILQILQLIHSYTTLRVGDFFACLLCISFKFCNWYIPIQLSLRAVRVPKRCVYPSNFAIDTFLYNIVLGKKWVSTIYTQV